MNTEDMTFHRACQQISCRLRHCRSSQTWHCGRGWTRRRDSSAAKSIIYADGRDDAAKFPARNPAEALFNLLPMTSTYLQRVRAKHEDDEGIAVHVELDQRLEAFLAKAVVWIAN